MIIPDINLLLYAHFTPFPQHAAAKRWWETALRDGTQVALAAPVVFGFVRIATNRRIFEKPMTVLQALAVVDGWLARESVRFALPGPRHLELAFGLLRALGTAANLTTDAQLAALAIEQQAELCSTDADFGRFSGLRWRNPLAEGALTWTTRATNTAWTARAQRRR